MKKADLALLGVAVCGGAWFLSMLDKLWPVPELSLSAPTASLVALAREHEDVIDLSLSGWDAQSQVSLDEPALSWLERTRSRKSLDRILEGAPVYTQEVLFKRRGEPGAATFWIHPQQGLCGWRLTMEDDAEGPRLDSLRAGSLVKKAAKAHLGRDLAEWELRRYERRRLVSRDDQTFVFEKPVEPGSDVKLRMSATVAGSVVREMRSIVVVPPSFLRGQRERQSSEQFLQTIAFSLFASMGVAAFLYKLWGLRRGMVGLKIPVIGAGLVVSCLAATRLLRTFKLFDLWDPLGPRWMASARVVLQSAVTDMLPALMVMAFLGAADALDREAPRHRGIALRNFLTLRWAHVDVGHASLRGFLLGWVAGGVLTLCTWGLSFVPGAQIEMQPRGFFFYGLNSAFPTLLLGLFFLQISLVEELGYRHFAGNALLRLGGRRWLAAIVPALIYGCVHSGLSFLPPADPWWIRVVPITLVGILWGFAFIRWDALTVVLSHWACDLFLFNRTRLFSEDPWERLSAVFCVALPLLPATVDITWRLYEKFVKQPDPEAWEDDPDFTGYDPGTEPELPATSGDDAEPRERTP